MDKESNQHEAASILGVAEGIKIFVDSSTVNFIVEFIGAIAFIANALAVFLLGEKKSKFYCGV
jgi:hypothetical protein